MASRRGNYVIVFNGEIYNYKELYAAYCSEDKSVNPNSDTAVLLALYERFNRGCVALLNGMFSFAIIDVSRKTVFLCRDRFGEKPLYWAKNDETFVFGSELTALRTVSPSIRWTLSPEAVVLYHAIGTIPPPHTIYREAFALRPGHWLELTSSGHVCEGRYWSAEDSLSQRSDPYAPTYEEATEETRVLLLEAVRSRMVSDVEIGLFLSGGYDSGALLSLIKSLDRDPITTLCIDFPHDSFSEFKTAQITAHQFNGTLYRKVVSAQDFLDGMAGYFSSMDQPTSDGYNTFFVSRAAKELGIKVWLSGVGGDELFGGYPFFKRIHKLKWLAFILSATLPSRLADCISPRLSKHLRLSRLLHLADEGNRVCRAYQTSRNVIPLRNVLCLLAAGIKEKIHNIQASMDSLYPNTDALCDDFQRATVLESTIYMRSQLLRDMDNFSMAHSIEVRAPFLDHRLFEHVLRLPQLHKQRENRIKPLLDDSLPLRLPEAVRSQRKKGFTFPVELWLKRQLADSFEDYVLHKDNSLFWDLGAVTNLWKTYLQGGVGWGVVWNLYAFSRWVKANNESL